MSRSGSKRGRRGSYRHMNFEEKYMGLKAFFERELTTSEVAELIGSSQRTVQGWLNKIDYDFANIERLRHKGSKRSDRGNIIHELEDSVKAEILSLVKKHPTMGPLKIKHYFMRHHQVLLSEKRIHYFLDEKGIIKNRATAKDIEEKHLRRFEYDKPLGAVQMDLMGLTLSGGTKVYLISIIDDYSRFMLASEFVPVKTMEEVIRVFSSAIKEYGIPERVITDKGSEFISWQSFSKFQELLVTLDIEHIASGPNKPQCQGKVERWHQTLRKDFQAIRGPFDFSSQAQIELNDFVDYYNNERPHQGIKGLVPADRFYGLETVLTEELKKYGSGGRSSEQIYFSCNIQGEKIVVSGPRTGELNVYRNNNSESQK